MSDIVDIIISAVDQASDVFRDIVGSASDMGSEISSSVSEAGDSISDLAEFTDEEVTYMMGELDEMPMSFDEIGDAASEASTGIDEIGSSIDGLDASEFEEMAGDVQDFGGSVNETSSEIQGLGDELSLVNAGMLIQTADQINNIAGNAEGMADSMNEAAITVGQLSTATGIAEPEMVSLINNISNVTFPQNEAMAYVEALHQMGVESSNFGSSATDMDRINDAFGIGYQNVIQLTRGMGVLGVDANNLSSSYNALAYVQSNVNGGVNTLNTVLGRQGATFQELGLDIDQVALIMDTASHKWTTARTLNSGLSSALKDCGGDLRALEKELGMQEGALDNASSVTGEYSGKVQELADEEKEHKTLLQDIGAAWEDVTLSASQVLSPLAGAVGLVGEMGSFGMQVQGIRNMGGAIKDTARWIGELNVVQGVLNTIRGITATETAVLDAEEMALAATEAGLTAEEIGAAAAHATNGAAIAAEGVAATGASGGFWALASAVIAATWPILLAVAAVVAFIAVIYEVGKAFGWWKDVGGMIDAIWDGVKRLWDAFINHPDVQAVIKGIMDVWNGLVSAIGGAWNAVMEFFGITTGGNFDVVYALIMAIGSAWDFIKQPIKAYINILSTIFDTIFQILTGHMSVQTGIMRIWGSLLVNVPVILSALATIFNTIFGGIFNFVIETASNIVTGVINYIRQLPGKVLNYLVRLARNFTTQGTKWVSTARSKANQVVNGVVNYLKNLPKRALTQLVHVVTSITTAGRKWVTAGVKYAGKLVSETVKKVTELPGKIASEFGKIPGKINESVTNAVNAAANFGSGIKDAVLKALHIASPGIVQRKIRSEFWDTVDRIKETVRPAYEAGRSYGASILNGFQSVDLTNESLLSDFNTAVDINGNEFDINTGQYYEIDDNMEITVKQEHEFLFDFRNVPEWIDTDQIVKLMKEAIHDKSLIRELVNNPDFQALDSEVKTKIMRRIKRSKGV